MKMTTINKINKKLLRPRSEPNYKLVEDLVYYVHKNLSNHELPINLSFMYSFKNLKVKTYSWFAKLHNISIEETINNLNSDSGCCYYDVFNDRYLILYNDLITNPCHNRWTLAHELGHYLLKHNEICDVAIIGRNSLGLEEYKVYEKEANAFARELLAPLNVLCCISDKKVTVSQIMELCDLSYEAANNIIDFANNGLQMGISYFCESKTTEIFKDFINNQKYLKFCYNCSYSFTSLNAKFCPICGHNKLIKGETKNKMKYNCEYHLDENGRISECPVCHNEEITDGEYCKICGTYLINRCTNLVYDEWGNQIEGCGQIAEANARYCIYCGSETTFYHNNLLCDYKDYKEHKKTFDEIVLEDNWKQVLNNLKLHSHIVLYTNLINTKLTILDGKTACVVFPNGITKFAETVILKEDNIKLIKEELNVLFFSQIDLYIKDEKANKYIYQDVEIPF